IWVIREQQPEVVVCALELRRPPEYPLLEPAVDLLEFGARDYQLRVRRYRPIALAPSLITDPVEKQRDAKEHADGADIRRDHVPRVRVPQNALLQIEVVRHDAERLEKRQR